MFTCVYVHMCICVCVYVSKYVYAHIHMYTYTRIHIYTYTHVHMYTHTQIRTHTHICTHARTHIHTHVHIYTYVNYSYRHTHIHIHTHIHTYIQTRIISVGVTTDIFEGVGRVIMKHVYARTWNTYMRVHIDFCIYICICMYTFGWRHKRVFTGRPSGIWRGFANASFHHPSFSFVSFAPSLAGMGGFFSQNPGWCVGNGFRVHGLWFRAFYKQVCYRTHLTCPYERWGAGVEYHFQELNEPYGPS